MPSPAPGLRRAVLTDLPDLAEMLGRAFAGDPMFRYLADPHGRPEDHLASMFRGVLRHLADDFADTLTTPDRQAVAVWNRPGYRAPQGLDGFRMLPHMAGLTGWRRIHLMMQVLGALDRRHKELMPGPHWYLLALAVAPDRQGQGLGTALMRPYLDRCDRDGLPAYLETSQPRNLPLYERHGFRVVDDVTMGKPPFPTWLMRRDPAAPA